MNLVERYLELAEQKKFAEGLPLIEEIVRRNPKISTSQFNYGICLTELGKHQEAARAFFSAYSLAPEDGGALYRGCLALAAANDACGLLDVFRRQCAHDPEMIHNFLEEKCFENFWKLPAFQNLKNEFII